MWFAILAVSILLTQEAITSCGRQAYPSGMDAYDYR